MNQSNWFFFWSAHGSDASYQRVPSVRLEGSSSHEKLNTSLPSVNCGPWWDLTFPAVLITQQNPRLRVWRGKPVCLSVSQVQWQQREQQREQPQPRRVQPEAAAGLPHSAVAAGQRPQLAVTRQCRQSGGSGECCRPVVWNDEMGSSFIHFNRCWDMTQH